MVGEVPDAAQVDVTTNGPNYQVQAEQVQEDLRGDRIPTRLGIDLSELVTKATIRLTIVAEKTTDGKSSWRSPESPENA